MNPLFKHACALLALPAVVWAVYAPVPEQEQGKALSCRLKAASYYDTNLFGAASGPIETMVYNFAPAVSFNRSVTDQTFVSAGYELSLDHMPDRPTDQTLWSHTFDGRFAHAFGQTTNIDLSESFQISKNPESLLAGVPLNTDQSFRRNESDVRFTSVLGGKTAVLFKYRNVAFDFDDASLGRNLDRMEHLAGVEGSYTPVPGTKLVGEYRYQAIYYRHAGAEKNKRSHFLLAGVDRSFAEKIFVTGRLGAEDRHRAAERNTTAPYAELSANWKYADRSFISGGYVFTMEEVSDVTRFTDTKVNRLFVNVQHAVTAGIVASGSLSYEPSQLQGRRTVADVDEDTMRLGLALTWQPSKNWALAATYDRDRTTSDEAGRRLTRERAGGSVRYSF